MVTQKTSVQQSIRRGSLTVGRLAPPISKNNSNRTNHMRILNTNGSSLSVESHYRYGDN